MNLLTIFKLLRQIPTMLGIARVYLEKIIVEWDERLWINKPLDKKELTFTKITKFNLPDGYISFLVDSSFRSDEFHQLYANLLQLTNPNWEMIIFPSVGQNMVFPWEDNRVLVKVGEGCLGASRTLMTGINVARGRWVIYVKPGWVYQPDLIERIAASDDPLTQPEILFWDEIFDGGRSGFVKPTWSPELWASVNILSQACYRSDFLKNYEKKEELQGWLGACIARAQTIKHVAGLFTIVPEATWRDSIQRDDHVNQVEGWLKENGRQDIHVDIQPGGELRWSWRIDPVRVSIIIPTRDHYRDITRCIESLTSITDYFNFEVIVVDDHSSDENVLEFYSRIERSTSQICFIHNVEKFNFGRVCNQGARVASGEILVFLNNDVEIIESNWLNELVQFCQLPGVGAVGGRLFYPDFRIQHTGIVVGLTGHANHILVGEMETECQNTWFGPIQAYRDVSAVTGACLAIRRDLFEEIGGFDERYQLIFSDVLLCMRVVQEGFRVVVNPWARIIHFESQSRSRNNPLDDLNLAQKEMNDLIVAGDPFYSQSLSRATCYPHLKRWYEMSAEKRLSLIMSYQQALQK